MTVWPFKKKEQVPEDKCMQCDCTLTAENIISFYPHVCSVCAEDRSRRSWDVAREKERIEEVRQQRLDSLIERIPELIERLENCE